VFYGIFYGEIKKLRWSDAAISELAVYIAEKKRGLDFLSVSVPKVLCPEPNGSLSQVGG
jgi:hypothetical protein